MLTLLRRSVRRLILSTAESKLSQRRRTCCGLGDVVVKWFTEHLRLAAARNAPARLTITRCHRQSLRTGIPQISILAPHVFVARLRPRSLATDPTQPATFLRLFRRRPNLVPALSYGRRLKSPPFRRLFMHYIHIGQAPKYLPDCVSTVSAASGRYRLRSTGSAAYVLPRTKFGERGFFDSGPAAWNTLPSILHHITDTSTFRKRLKNVLFDSAYN